MSIYIYGVDLPQHGFINLTVFANGHVVGPDDGFNSFDTVAGRAIPVPEHGDLIERDELLEKQFTDDNDDYVVYADDVDEMPAIVPANKEGRI